MSALVIAAFTLCAAPAFYATSAAAATAKPAAAKKASTASSTTSAKAKKVKAVRTASRQSRSLANGASRSPYWQCVTFARSLTGMQIFGDAWTWWDKANAKYDTGTAPKPGAVMVFPRQGKMNRGHVAVVSQIITDRYIQITHANWSPINGRRGQVEKDVNVMDVSARGDWSKVKVWYGPLNDFGTTVYATNGFIYQDTPEGQAQAQKIIAESEGLPPEPQPYATKPYQQIAAAPSTPAPEMPAALKAALTPDNDRGFLAVKANTVAAHVTGNDAAAIVARIDADKAQAAGKTAKGSSATKAPSRP
ncbi:CHAP domain-containing protein [Asticcacaulis biprosthecium]|uniref:CHAP domain-containing protein n=1 Tax=Asticcacaulis biprosthecium TaxID=76891 RepID=UPI0035AC0C6A